MMKQVLGLVVVLLGLPSLHAAPEVHERFLPIGSQLYMSFDGMEHHKAEFEKTALGRILQGDTGKLVKQLLEGIDKPALAALQQALDLNEDESAKARDDLLTGLKFLSTIKDHGFVLGVEVRLARSPEVHVGLVLPKAGKHKAEFDALVRLAKICKLTITEGKVEDRNVSQVKLDHFRLGWWTEGEDVILLASTLDLEAEIKALKNKNLTHNTLYKRTAEFKEFKTVARGYGDLAAGMAMFKSLDKRAGRIIDDLGLTGLKSVAIYTGFDGVCQRNLVDLDCPGPRKGLLKLMTAKKMKLADLPALPSDLTSLSATHLDWKEAYDLLLKAAESVMAITRQENPKKSNELAKRADEIAGIKIRDDLLVHFDTLSVQYAAPSDGMFGLGGTLMIKVKDPAKVDRALQKMIEALAKNRHWDMKMKDRKYRDVPVREIRIQKPGNVYVPTYAVHKNWLVIGLYPQPVHAYIQRTRGELPVWKPGPRVEDGLKKMPPEFGGIGLSDPRQGVRLLLTVAPVLLGALDNNIPGFDFDVSLIPPIQEVEKDLFPNVAILIDDGDKVRISSRSSVCLPGSVAVALAAAITAWCA